MVDAANLLGIEAMTGHWEFTYGEEQLRENLKKFKGEFLAQNVFLTEEAAFNDKPAFDTASGRVFKPAAIKEVGGARIGVIGQAFPYVPIAHPKRFTPDWTFGIRDAELQKLVDELRSEGQSRRRGAVVAQRHGRRPETREPRHRHRRHSRRPYPRRGAAADHRDECGRQDAGEQCRVERQVFGRDRSRCRQGRGQGCPLSSAAGLCRPAEGGRRDAGADRSREPSRTPALMPKSSASPATSLPARQFQRHHGPVDLRRAAPGTRCGAGAVARLPLGQYHAAGRADHAWPMCCRKPRSPIRRSMFRR